MTTVSTVHHAGCGHTKLAKAVVAGLRQSPDATVSMIVIDAGGDVSESAWGELDASGAIVFGSPTCMDLSWQFRNADATSKCWFTQGWRDELFAGFTNPGIDQRRQVRRHPDDDHAAMQDAGPWVGTGMMPANGKPAQRNDVNDLGAYAGLMAQSPSDASSDGPLFGALGTANRFDRRVADAVTRFTLAVPEVA